MVDRHAVCLAINDNQSPEADRWQMTVADPRAYAGSIRRSRLEFSISSKHHLFLGTLWVGHATLRTGTFTS